MWAAFVLSVDQVGGVDQADALGLRLGQELGEHAKGFGVGVADSDGLVLLPGFLESQLQLVANRAVFLNIIEKGNIAISAGNTGGLRPDVGNGGGSSAAIDEEKMMRAEQWHEFSHKLRIGRGEGALMVVDASGIRHRGEHGVQRRRDLRGGHAGAKLCCFWRLIGHGFHGEMKHDLISTAMAFLSDFRGAGVVGEHGEGERIVEGENRVYRGGIGGDVVEDDGEAGAGYGGVGRTWCGRMAGFGGVMGVNEGVVGGFDFVAAGERQHQD